MTDTVQNLAAAMAARTPDAAAGWRDGAAVGNAHVVARMAAWRALLAQQPGRNYALYLEDSVEFGAALLGAWQAGKTVWLSADTLEASCTALGASVDGFLGEFPAALSPLQPAAVTTPAQGASAYIAMADDFPALVVFTSGSTGAAQAIPKKMSQLASEVATLEMLFGADASDAAVLSTVSHQHIYGLLFKVLWPLSTGRVIHAHSIVYPEQLAPVLAAGPCVLVASPAHLKRLPSHLDWSGAGRMLRAVFSSGGPLAPETARECGNLLGKVPVEVYGSSETGGIAWRQRGDRADDSWQPFPTVDWRLNPQDGRFEVRSPHLADDDWLALADRAQAAGEQPGGTQLTGERRFMLLGRTDRIVKIEEKRISLDAMEAALLATGLAAEARVVLCAPVAGERQKLAAFVVPSAGGSALLEQGGKPALNGKLRAALAAVVDAVALPRRWRYLEQMPVNAQGKTTLAALLALLDSEAAPRLPRVIELEHDAQVQPQRVLLSVSAPAKLLYFDGHFTDAPILPGVAQLDWAIHYGRQYFDLPPRFRSVQALKFQQVIQPEQTVQLELLYDAAKGSLQFRYTSDAGAHASGRISMQAEGANG